MVGRMSTDDLKDIKWSLIHKSPVRLVYGPFGEKNNEYGVEVLDDTFRNTGDWSLTENEIIDLNERWKKKLEKKLFETF